MPDFRVHCRPADPAATEMLLTPDESHHLVVVNRARIGDPVVAFDGDGNEWLCTLASDHRKSAALRVRSRGNIERLPYEITLAQALPKGTGMDAIVRKATEIGARRIVPLETERTQVHLDDARSDRKREKWRIAALEAAKQCGNPFLPELLPVQSLDTFVKGADSFDLKLIASLHPGATSLRKALASYRAAHPVAPRRVAWLIGPEGDFSPGEVALAVSHGFQPITLGPLVLRCETAAIYALSTTSHELQSD